MSDFYYLGSPYSKYHAGIDAAFHEVCIARGLLIKAGIPCFSPIIHSHSVAAASGLDPLDYAIWMPSERPIMDAACGLIVLKLDGWEKSIGLCAERMFFEDRQLPIIFMTPGVVPIGLFG